jgi:hypothetical protein
MSRRAKGAYLALMAVVPGAGCSDEFPPYNRLESLRVLAIQSEPAAPLVGQTATFTPVMFTPTEDPSLTYRWSWCPAPGPGSSGFRCLMTEAELAVALGPDVSFPPFDLGTGPTAMLPVGLPPEVMAAVCNGTIPDLPTPSCTGGFPVQVALTVRTDTDQVEAVVTARWRFDQESQAPNANPSIDGLVATLADGQAQPIAEVLEADALILPRKVQTAIGAVIAPEASESYVGLDDDGLPATLRERLFITWFVETGDTSDARTSYYPDRTPFDTLLKNGWTPAETDRYPPGEARVVIVLHDNRGGVGWRQGIVRLEAAP